MTAMFSIAGQGSLLSVGGMQRTVRNMIAGLFGG